MKHELDKISSLKWLLSELPPAHYELLKYLVQHLNRYDVKPFVNKILLSIFRFSIL